MIFIVLSLMSYLVFATGKYWYADTLYARGKAYNGSQKAANALKDLTSAIRLEPNQPLYHNEIATSYTYLALSAYQQKDANKTKEFGDLAVSESDKAIALSHANVNLRRSRFGVFIMLSSISPNTLLLARDTLLDTVNYAPTDAKLYYNLGLTHARIGDDAKAVETFKKTIELKNNYKEPRLAYALILINQKNYAPAREQLNYILERIDPNDSLTKQTLEGIK